MANPKRTARLPREVRSADEIVKKYDDGSGVKYFAFALPGTGTDEAKWKIMKLDKSDGLNLTKTYADGDSKYDNVADDYLTYSYS